MVKLGVLKFAEMNLWGLRSPLKNDLRTAAFWSVRANFDVIIPVIARLRSHNLNFEYKIIYRLKYIYVEGYCANRAYNP